MKQSAPLLLSARDVTVTFEIPRGPFRKPGLLRAVSGVSFDLHEGETLGIVGESGCGKSNLGSSLLRLLPATGRILWQGQDLLKLNQRQMRPLRRDLQIIFQDPLAALDPRMSVAEIVAEPLETFPPRPGEPPLDAKGRRERALAMLARVGLDPGMADRYPHEFSGGQAQRIGIARAMVLRPKLVVCDEPVSALDVSIRAQIMALLLDLQRETGMALLFISHDMAVVRHICHRVMVLYLGRQAELAGCEDLCTAPRHPYTRALMAAVPVPDPDLERQRRALRRTVAATGELPSPFNPPSGCVFRTRCPQARTECAETIPVLEEPSPGHRVACPYWEQ